MSDAMAIKRFWDDPYRTELDTTVAAVAGADIALVETIFYAFSGGQESDAGSIGGRPVLAVRKEGAEILYTLGEGHALRAGDAARVLIDWGRRYRLMRLHFAAELVLELTNRRCPGIEKIGAHIAEDRARIDFIWAESLAPLLHTIQAEVAAIVAADHSIISAFSDETAGRRYWEIAGFARVACGGTHLRRTGEVGAVELRRRNPGRGKERIEIALREGV